MRFTPFIHRDGGTFGLWWGDGLSLHLYRGFAHHSFTLRLWRWRFKVTRHLAPQGFSNRLVWKAWRAA